jgi:hypothetical protein
MEYWPPAPAPREFLAVDCATLNQGCDGDFIGVTALATLVTGIEAQE